MSNKNKKQEQDGEVRPLDALVMFQREDFEKAGFTFDAKFTAQWGNKYNEWFKNESPNVMLGCNYKNGMIKILTGNGYGNRTLFEGALDNLKDLDVIWKCIQNSRYIAYKEAK